MVGVVIVRARAEDDVGLPIADQSNDRATVFERRRQLAVGIVHDLDRRSQVFEASSTSLRRCKRPASLAPMADVAIGDRDERMQMALRGPHRPSPADRKFAIVGMRAEGDDAQLAVAGEAGGGLFKIDRRAMADADRSANVRRG